MSIHNKVTSLGQFEVDSNRKDITIMEKEVESLAPSKENITVSESEIKLAVPSAPSLRKRSIARNAGTDRSNSIAPEHTLTRTGKFFFDLLENRFIRYCLYIIPIGSLIAIPLALFATLYRSKKVSGISILGIFVYVEVVWFSLWVSKLIASSLPYLFQGLCGIISTGVRKYALLLRAIEVPVSIFIWSIFAMCWIPLIYVFEKDYYWKTWRSTNSAERLSVAWVHTLRQVMKASVGSAALLLLEKTLMQLISVNYHGKQYRDKIKDIKCTTRCIDKLYSASLARYHDHHPDFIEEDYDIHDTTNVQKLLRSYQADRSVLRVFGDMHYFGEKLVAAFGRMATDVTGTTVLQPTATHAIVEAALERRVGAEALARRIYRSLAKPGADAILESDIMEALGHGHEEEATLIFAQLDKDANGDVNLEEMLMLVVNNSRERKDMWKSANNIKDAIKVLDRVFSLIILLLVALIYSAFFSDFVASNYKQIFSIFSASAFSFGQTVGEFNAACILVFVKHPFDIGDRINVGDAEYEVIRISLLYTVFRRVETNTLVQIANNVIGSLWVDNITRSGAMKERLAFSVNSSTGFNEIEALRAELQAFVRAPENTRDYQDDVEIQLTSVGDLSKLELRVEVRHKSNWHNESLRQYRRSKFMCALISAVRKVGIDNPGGGGASQGSISNPNYSVVITEDKVAAAKAEFDEKKAAKKQQPDRVLPEVEKTLSSGLEILPALARGFQTTEDRQLRLAAGLPYQQPH